MSDPLYDRAVDEAYRREIERMSEPRTVIDPRELRRDIIAALIAVRGHLTEPYPDDPRWTPWDRFVEPALRKVDELASLAAKADVR